MRCRNTYQDADGAIKNRAVRRNKKKVPSSLDCVEKKFFR